MSDFVIVIQRTHIYVGSVRRHALLWHESIDFSPDLNSAAGELASALRDILDRIAMRGCKGSVAHLAFGEPYARLKRIRGVPLLKVTKERLNMVQLNADRFVLAREPVFVGSLVPLGDDEVEISIISRAALATIARVLAERGMSNGRVMPLAAVQCVMEQRDNGSPANIGQVLTAFAGVWRSSSHSLSPRNNPGVIRPMASPMRVGTAAAACALALAGTLVAHIEHSHLRDRRIQVADARIAPLADTIASEAVELEQLKSELGRVVVFSARRRSVSLLLNEITEAIPAEASLNTLQVDSSGINLVSLAPRSADVVDALSEVNGVGSPTIVGPVSATTIGTKEVERASIHMTVGPADTRAKRPFVANTDRDQ